MKVVINACFGGFSLSEEACNALGVEWDGYGACMNIERNDPRLVQVVEQLGSDRAGGIYAKLKVVEIPDDISWHIDEYDGNESVHEDHGVWS